MGLDSVALSVVLSPGLVSVAVAVALDSAGFVSVAVAVSLDSAGLVSVAVAVTLDSAGLVSVAEAVSLDSAVFVVVSVVAVVALVVVVVIGGCGVSISWKAAPRMLYRLLFSLTCIKPWVLIEPLELRHAVSKSVPISGAVTRMKSSSEMAAPFVPSLSPLLMAVLALTW